MRFGVHNHYNNNADGIGDFNHPEGFPLMSEIPVRVTDQGLTIFNLRKGYDLKEKLKLATQIDEGLKREFGTGLSFATCSSSDCVQEFELAPYYNGMKALNPEIVTVYATARIADEWVTCPAGLPVDHIVDQWHDPAKQIVSILAPTEEDKAQPAEGWESYENRLKKLFKDALKTVDVHNAPRAQPTTALPDRKLSL